MASVHRYAITQSIASAISAVANPLSQQLVVSSLSVELIAIAARLRSNFPYLQQNIIFSLGMLLLLTEASAACHVSRDILLRRRWRGFSFPSPSG